MSPFIQKKTGVHRNGVPRSINQRSVKEVVFKPQCNRLHLVGAQVLAAEFVWSQSSGPFATNLSSSRAIDDVAKRFGQRVFRSAVGEINVVEKMKEVGAVLGGEGNGGVILPDLHYGRDALVGIAITLQHLVDRNEPLSTIRSSLPDYAIAKKKVAIDGSDPDALLGLVREKVELELDSGAKVTDIDGVKIDLDEGWVHMRKSNTEPIIRVYAEALSPEAAADLADRYIDQIERCRTEA